MKFSIQDFFSKCDQIRRKQQIWSHLLKKSLMENFIFCAVIVPHVAHYFWICLQVLTPLIVSHLILTMLKTLRFRIVGSASGFRVRHFGSYPNSLLVFWFENNFHENGDYRQHHLAGIYLIPGTNIIRPYFFLLPFSLLCYYRKSSYNLVFAHHKIKFLIYRMNV